MNKIRLFFYLLELFLGGEISFYTFRTYNYDSKRSIKVLIPQSDNVLKEEELFFNKNLIPIDEEEWKIINTESVLVN